VGHLNIRVNSVCPGIINTDMVKGVKDIEVIKNDFLDCMPIRRWGEVQDIANVVRFLCGPESSWITGVALSVDGGHHLRRGPNFEPLARMLFGDDITEGRMQDS
jgi:NAD(P)-dependent dehydrogenase (short-subunit alcohol dehydrogenase family)